MSFRQTQGQERRLSVLQGTGINKKIYLGFFEILLNLVTTIFKKDQKKNNFRICSLALTQENTESQI